MLFSDDETKRRVQEQLKWDSRIEEEARIDVDVANGRIVLRGTVPSYVVRQAAEYDTLSIPGVNAVENRLEIRFPESYQPPLDREIRDSIRNVYSWDPALSNQDVVIEVNDGVVKLSGAVDAIWKKKRAEEHACNLSGVALVSNELAVVPTHDILDEIIAEDIIAALDRNIDIDLDNIDVRVAGGRVTLSGTVPDFAAYRTAENIVHYTAGVVEMTNDLAISESD